MTPKGVLSWRFDAISHQSKPRRVADPPTKHRPQISVVFRAQQRAKPPAATELHHGGECENHRSCARDESIAGARQDHRSDEAGRCEMSDEREGWTVDVDGQAVIISFLGDDDGGRRAMSRDQVRLLREQLRLAYLLAGRNMVSTGATGEAVSGSALVRDQLHLHPADMTLEEWARYREFAQGYLESVERDAPDASRDLRFVDGGNPGADIESGSDESESPAGPKDEDRARFRADLLSRAAQVQANGWEPYRGLWSTGEVVGVAALLGEHAELAALGETVQSAWERWAFQLWGLDRGQADVDNGCEATREWFLDAAYEFAGPELRELMGRAKSSPTVRRTFGQSPGIEIPEDFDAPLPPEELDGWDGAK